MSVRYSDKYITMNTIKITKHCWLRHTTGKQILSRAITLFIIAFNHPHNSILINLFTGEDVRPITRLDWHRPLITKDVKNGGGMLNRSCTDGFNAASLCSSAQNIVPHVYDRLIVLQHVRYRNQFIFI